MARGVPHRARSARRAARPRRRVLRRPDRARRRELSDQRPPRARRSRHRHRPRSRRPRPQANAALGRLDRDVARRDRARRPTRSSPASFRDQFVVDVYQAGAGTSHNMNANEVLANRAAEILGEPRGTYTRVHPNDHVNMGQSTNDVFPTATRLALLLGCRRRWSTRRARWPTRSTRKADEFARRAEDRPHAPAGRRADHARPGVRRLRRLRPPRRRRCRARRRSSCTS